MIAHTVLMVRPIRFGYNEQTADTNAFQKKLPNFSSKQIQDIALLEFDNFVATLRQAGVRVMVVQDTPEPHTPDSIFPNNWFSTCPHTKTLYTYPMYQPNRAAERREDIIAKVTETNDYKIDKSLVDYRDQHFCLEGTGALVLDHQNKIAYCALSPRADLEVIRGWQTRTGYDLVHFHAYGPDGNAIYHTNVLMAMADEYVVIALDAINRQEKSYVIDCLINKSNKAIINISFEQMNLYAGNMLQLQNSLDEKLLVMSTQAFDCLTEEQLGTIQQKFQNTIVHAPIHVIEAIGGGSARCMLAEIFD